MILFPPWFQKINQKYITDPERFSTLQTMALHDKKAEQSHMSSSATCAMLWLKRYSRINTIALYLSIVFYYVFQIAPGRPTDIYGSHIVLHCSGLAVRHSLHIRLFPEARAQRLLVCGRALLAEARTRSNTIEIYIQ